VIQQGFDPRAGTGGRHVQRNSARRELVDQSVSARSGLHPSGFDHTTHDVGLSLVHPLCEFGGLVR